MTHDSDFFFIRCQPPVLGRPPVMRPDRRTRSAEDNAEMARRLLVYAARAARGEPLFEQPAWPVSQEGAHGQEAAA